MEPLQLPEGFKEQRLYVLPEYKLNELAQSELTKHLYISDIGVFPRAQFHYRERPQGCNAHIFIYCTAGEGWVELDGHKQVRVAAEHLVVIPAGTPHRYGASAHAPWSIHWLHLQGEHAAPLIAMYGLNSAGPIHLPPRTSSGFLEDFEQCYVSLSQKNYSMPIQVHVSNLIRQLLSRIGISISGSEQDKKKESYLETAIQFMNDRLDDSIKLSELARHTGLSKQHLIYLFNKETGFPPIDFFLRMKMQKAGKMLTLTDLTIKQIGYALGIVDPYYFSRLFKKIMGVSPAAYRKIPKG